MKKLRNVAAAITARFAALFGLGRHVIAPPEPIPLPPPTSDQRYRKVHRQTFVRASKHAGLGLSRRRRMRKERRTRLAQTWSRVTAHYDHPLIAETKRQLKRPIPKGLRIGLSKESRYAFAKQRARMILKRERAAQ